MGIREVGQTTAETLEVYCKNLNQIMDSTEEELLEIPEVGPIVAKNIHNFFTQEKNKRTINAHKNSVQKKTKRDYEKLSKISIKQKI